MSYLLSYYAKGDRHHCRLTKDGDEVLATVFSAAELVAFLEMIKLLDPDARVEQREALQNVAGQPR